MYEGDGRLQIIDIAAIYVQTCDIDLTVFPGVYPRYGFVINFSNPPVVRTDEIKNQCVL